MPESWTFAHEVTWFAQIRTRPGPDGWAESEHTGLMLAVCNCGLNTGWIPRDQLPSTEALDDGDQHAALLVRTPARDRAPATEQRITDLLRGLAPGQPVTRIWGRRSGATAKQGQEGNAWAADPEDIADLVVRALTEEDTPCRS